MGNKHNNNDEQEEKKKYFSLVSQTILKHKYIINHYPLNTQISFQNNFLNENSNIKKGKIRQKKLWKTYLLNFFKKRIQKGHEFYSDIIHDMERQKFGFEKKYLSIMFFIDYEKTYNRNNKDIYYQKYINEKEELDYEDILKKRLSRYSNVEKAVSQRTKSLMNVDIDDTGNTSFDKNLKRMQVINLVKIIEKQLEQKPHPINIVISIFEKHISSLIDNLRDSYEKDYRSNEELFLNKITKLNDTIVTNIQKFAKRIHTATKLFYSRVIHLDCFEEEKDELINVIMSILFNTGTLHEKIFEMFSLEYKKDINELKCKLGTKTNIRPKDLQIDDKFCLDENTDRLINELKEKYYKNNGCKNEYKEKDKDKDEDEEEKPLYDIIFNSSKNNTIIKKKNIYKGYTSAIDIIKNKLPNMKSPYKKMTLIASLSTEINECIDFYWDGRDQIIPKAKYLVVNPDELLKIFIYIVVSSQSCELFIHRKIAQKFTFKLTQQSMIGFYNSTCDAAISYIQQNLLNDEKSRIDNSINTILSDFEILTNEKKIKEDNRLYVDGINDDDDDDDDDNIIINEQSGNKGRYNTKISSFNICTSFAESKNKFHKNSSMVYFFEGYNK